MEFKRSGYLIAGNFEEKDKILLLKDNDKIEACEFQETDELPFYSSKEGVTSSFEFYKKTGVIKAHEFIEESR